MLCSNADLSQIVGGARIILPMVCIEFNLHGIIIKVKSMSPWFGLFCLAIKQYHKGDILFYLFFNSHRQSDFVLLLIQL
jgi:hypothetical protein